MSATSRIRCVVALVVCVAGVTSGCGRAEPAQQKQSEPVAQVGSEPAALPRPSEVEPPSSEVSESTDPEPLVTGRPCDEANGAEAEIAEQERARIPLVVGLTFAYIWRGPTPGKDDWDHECLTQVTAVDARRVVYLSRCAGTKDSSRQQTRTQLCRADLRDGTIYRTEHGVRIPDLVAGSTMNLLSRRSFRELRERGETGFRQVHLLASTWQTGAEAPEPDATVYVQEDVGGPLRRTGTGTLAIHLNDSLVTVPVIHAEVVLRESQRRFADQNERLVILDDERAPVVLDNQRSTNNASIRFVRITWPRRASLEKDLAEDRKSILYGIYFDFNSDEIRKESEVVLAEIAGVLEAHPDWSLRIDGHTDSIGGAASNQDLSVRRAEAVATALVERYGIVAARLATGGSGASRPLDRNDTPEGRARNRRVELTRP